MDRMSELKQAAENAIYEAAKLGQQMEKAKCKELQRQVELLTLGLLKEKNKYDALHAIHEKLVEENKILKKIFYTAFDAFGVAVGAKSLKEIK